MKLSIWNKIKNNDKIEIIPTYLIVILIILKIYYIINESIFNLHVFDITTSTNITKEVVEKLNNDGHLLSSFGITLLLLPLIIKFLIQIFNKINFSNKFLMIPVLLFSIFFFISTYKFLNFTIDTIVEQNKEKRHDAYYFNLFKYGLLNNVFSYNSFIENSNINNKQQLNTNEKILFINSFILLHLDDNFINKFKEKGAHKFSELYIDMFLKADFDKDFNSFVKASEKISTLWNTFNNNRKILKENLDNTDSLLDTKTIKKHHLELINELENKYINYIKMYNEIEKQQIEKMPNDNEIRNIKKDLEKYFKYKNHRKYGNKAEFEYRNNITHRFGHYVRPEKWKDENYEITEKQIKKTIKKEIEKEIKSKVNYNISTPKGLNSKEFLNHHDVKVEVAKKLKDKGISIPYNFDYSYNQFEKYYKFSILSNYNSSETTFYSKLKDKIGKNDLKLSFNWQQFSKSNFIKDSIKSEIDKINSKNLTYSDINTILNIIESKDLSKFKTDIYIPKVKKELEKFLYIKNDFEDGGKAVEDGNNAIKFLYLPPLALILSMIALILNVITVVVLFLQLINLNRFKIILVKVIFSLFVLFLPFYFNQNLIKNNILISKIEINNEFKIYMNILDWIAYYQDMNVRIHENNKVKFFKKIIYVPTNFK